MKDQQQITIRLRCIELPGKEFAGKTGIRLGVQKGQEVIEDVPGDQKEVIFDCPMRVEKNAVTGKPNFLGPYAQGTVGERYIYLCWGETTHGFWAGFRRAKVHLKDIEWATVEKHLKSGKAIEAVISMTGKKGDPLCASVGKDNIEWKF